VWVSGYWEQARRAHRYQAGRWDLQGDHYVWTAGTWQPVPQYPTQAPPAPIVENVGPRHGYVWISGYHEWRDGAYNWVPGRWERVRRGHRWQSGQWHWNGSHYEWHDGRWIRG